MKKQSLLLHNLAQAKHLTASRPSCKCGLSWKDLLDISQSVHKDLHVACIVFSREALDPACPRLLNRLLIISRDASKQKVSTNEDGSATLACMAVHEHLASVADEEVHDLRDVEKLLEARCREVRPEEVEVGDPFVHKELGRVTEACLGVYTIAAEGMLSRFLQVENRCYPFSKMKLTI